MIRPDGFRGAAFGTAVEGDARRDAAARLRLAADLDIPAEWAVVGQVHGAGVVEAEAPGDLGRADAIFTRRPGLPIAVGVADCVPIVVEADRAAAVIHAGWKGIVAGVVEAAIAVMEQAGTPPRRAAIGPAIGPCCYEVGDDVADLFDGHRSHTTWGTTSVDLGGAVADRLRGLELWRSPACTYTDAELWSYRRDATTHRQVAVAWLPGD